MLYLTRFLSPVVFKHRLGKNHPDNQSPQPSDTVAHSDLKVVDLGQYHIWVVVLRKLQFLVFDEGQNKEFTVHQDQAISIEHGNCRFVSNLGWHSRAK
jgi:hypothetical protein